MENNDTFYIGAKGLGPSILFVIWVCILPLVGLAAIIARWVP